MPRKTKINKCCKNCKKEFVTLDKRTIFCSKSCSTRFNNVNREHSDETKEKISCSLKVYNKINIV